MQQWFNNTLTNSSICNSVFHSTFALHAYILEYPIILLVDSEGPDQTADAQADLGLRCPHMPEDTFRMARPMVL